MVWYGMVWYGMVWYRSMVVLTSRTRDTTSSHPRCASLGDTLHPNAGLAAPVIWEMDSSRAKVGALMLFPDTKTTPRSSASESGT